MDSLRPRFHPVYHRYDCGRPRKANCQKPCFETSGTGSCCPSFFASGSFLEVVGDTVGGIPKCTVSRIVSRVSTTLVRKQQEFIRWPSTAAERQEIKGGFFEKDGFAGVIGCIDRTDIHIHMTDYRFRRTRFHFSNKPVSNPCRPLNDGVLLSNSKFSFARSYFAVLCKFSHFSFTDCNCSVSGSYGVDGNRLFLTDTLLCFVSICVSKL